MAHKKKKPASATRRLHRTLGAAAALFVLFMVLTGLAINHANGLGLDRKHVTQSTLLDWYGLEEPDNLLSFDLGQAWISFAGSQLFFNERPVATVNGGAGAVSAGGLLVAASSDELLLLDSDGTLVERLPWVSIDPQPIRMIGLTGENVVVVRSGDRLWTADADLLNWRQAAETNPNLRWASPQPAADTLQQAIRRAYRGQGLNLERVLLDLHSGRIFGPVGVLVYDVLAVVLGFLSISGLVLWFRGRRNGKSK
jgi:PepSY-associated TM region